MSRYINAEIVKERLKEVFEDFGDRLVIDSIVDILPTADVKEVVHGEWIDLDLCVKCSYCGHFEHNPYFFCPHCGADMR